MDKSDWIAISGFLLVITLIALWCLDISVSAIISDGYLTNGFLKSDPYLFYHIGLYLVILVSFANFLILIHIINKKPDSKTTKKKKSQKIQPYNFRLIRRIFTWNK